MKKLCLIAIGLISSMMLQAQEKWVLKSDYLTSPDTVFVFKPKTYHPAEKYPLVYLLHGYSENYRQWSKTTDLQKRADDYNCIIVTPDGFTSFYLNSPQNKGVRYEDFFFKELVPKVHQAFHIDEKNIFISGLSMGGYGALRYFILHPGYFNTAGATSGALEIDYPAFQHASQHFWQTSRMTDDLIKHIGDPAATDWSRYSISTLLQETPGFSKPFIFDCGTDDILYPASLRLKALTDRLHIPATFMAMPGNHNTAYWNTSIDYHFVYFAQHKK